MRATGPDRDGGPPHPDAAPTDAAPTGAGRAGVAVVLPGTGSTAGFVTRAFGPALAAAGYRLVVPDPVPGPRVVEAAFDALDDAAARHDVRLVGGVSLGAHVAARWAVGGPARPRLRGLLLALPAWTGPPGAVAGASAAAAARVRALGVPRVLDLARREGVPWVADELAAAWPRYGDALADTLEAAARSAGPQPGELARIAVPVGLAAFVDDPLHPASVAEHWAAVLPRAVVHRLRLADCAADRAALGVAAVSAWRCATRDG